MQRARRVVTAAALTGAVLISALAFAAPLKVSSPAEAQTAAQSGVKAKSAASHKAPLHPHQLTLYPHGKPARRSPAYSYTRHRFDRPTAVHNTFMAPGY